MDKDIIVTILKALVTRLNTIPFLEKSLTTINVNKFTKGEEIRL